ncbi:AraC family transcriptional regulator [Spirosoma sp.]|uniref:helix-turn-helix domain-containing protein n=1 Tax=Spirosoma sp. TaxID=1899569 RepID=UPI00262363BF|nr:AraC family transcriptional regulator [Spirosoma sp.]MCX6215825.1 AraC family transcriptional regulator [Spirosoma sp.]
MENWKAIAFLLAFGQGVLLSTSLILKNIRQTGAHFFLGIILLCLSLEILNAWGMQVHYHHSPTAFPFWNFQSYLLIPLSVWFFARLTTSPAYMFRRGNWWLFLPAGLEITIRWGISQYQHMTGTPVPSLLSNPVWFSLTELLPILGMVVSVWLYGANLIRYQRALTTGQSVLPIHSWLRLYGFFSFLVMLTLSWAAGVLVNWPIFAGLEILLSFVLFTYGYLAYWDVSYFLLPPLPKTIAANKPEFSHYDPAIEWQRIQHLFEQGTIYVQPKLTLEQVAQQLDLPVRYVSYLINMQCATNFNQYVNQYRVAEVIRKMHDPKEQHKTLLALALEAGFSSKSTFNQVFKQHTRQSPSQYLSTKKPQDLKPLLLK